MKYFCKNCGFINNYMLTIPDSCGKCNTVLGSLSLKASSADYISKDLIIDKREINENQDDNTVLDFKKVKPKFKLIVYGSKASLLSDLISSNETVDNVPNLEYSNNKQSLKENSQQRSSQDILLELIVLPL